MLGDCTSCTVAWTHKAVAAEHGIPAAPPPPPPPLWRILWLCPITRPPNLLLCSCCAGRYRAAEEMRAWRARDPVARFQRWLADQGWWDDAADTAARQAARR